MRQWQGILRADLIQVGEIDIHTILSIIFLDDNNVCQPIRVLNYDHQANLDEFTHFFVDDPIYLCRELSLLLLDRDVGWVDLQSMGND